VAARIATRESSPQNLFQSFGVDDSLPMNLSLRKMANNTICAVIGIQAMFKRS
jgi:hypothetical protein